MSGVWTAGMGAWMTEPRRTALMGILLCSVMVAWSITLLALVSGRPDIATVGALITAFTIYATWRLP